MKHISRRAALAAIPVSALVIATPVVASNHEPDAALEAAWQRRVEALDAYDLIFANNDTPEEAHLLAIAEAADEVILNTPASSPRGLAVHLWASLARSVDSTAQFEAVQRRDLEALSALADDLEWPQQVTITALRSLEAQGR